MPQLAHILDPTGRTSSGGATRRRPAGRKACTRIATAAPIAPARDIAIVADRIGRTPRRDRREAVRHEQKPEPGCP